MTADYLCAEARKQADHLAREHGINGTPNLLREMATMLDAVRAANAEQAKVIERLTTARECDERDPAHANCRNVEAQLKAQLSVESRAALLCNDALCEARAEIERLAHADRGVAGDQIFLPPSAIVSPRLCAEPTCAKAKE